MQFIEAKEQRKSAGRALEQAEAARGDALKASAGAREAKLSAEQASSEAQKAVANLRTNTKLLLEMDYLTPKLVLESYDPARVKGVRQKLEEFAVPDENERKMWLESLRKRTPK